MNRRAHLESAAEHARAARLLAAVLLHSRRVPERLLREALQAIVRHSAYSEAVAEALFEIERRNAR